jgi:hypothetical protein
MLGDREVPGSTRAVRKEPAEFIGTYGPNVLNPPVTAKDRKEGVTLKGLAVLRTQEPDLPQFLPDLWVVRELVAQRSVAPADAISLKERKILEAMLPKPFRGFFCLGDILAAELKVALKP